MPTLTFTDAVQQLSRTIDQLSSDDLIEVHNELFPDAPVARNGERKNRNELLASIVGHVKHGLEVEEVVDLWNVVFPKDRNVWYDEESSLLHFNEEPQEIEFPG